MLESCVCEQERLEKLLSDTDEFEAVYVQKLNQMKQE